MALQYVRGRLLFARASTISTAQNHHLEVPSSQTERTGISSKNLIEVLSRSFAKYFYLLHYMKKAHKFKRQSKFIFCAKEKTCPSAGFLFFAFTANYLRGFLMFACAAAWMSEAASAYFIPRNYLRGLLIFACASSERDFLRRCSLSRGNTSPFRPLLLSASRKCKTLSPSAFLRCSAKLSLLRSFSLGGCFRGGAPRFPLCITKSPLLRAFRVSYFRNYLRGFLIFACAAAWMSEAASAHFILRNYLRGFLMLACAAASLAIGTRKGEQET